MMIFLLFSHNCALAAQNHYTQLVCGPDTKAININIFPKKNPFLDLFSNYINDHCVIYRSLRFYCIIKTKKFCPIETFSK